MQDTTSTTTTTEAPAATGAATAEDTTITTESTPGVETAAAEETTDSDTSTEAKSFTQVELDKVVNEARAKVKKQFTGFDDYKAKAEAFDTQAAQLTNLQGALIASAIDKAAAANKSTLKGEHLARLLDTTALKVEENGSVNGADEAVKAFLEANPEYVTTTTTPGVGDRAAGETNPPKGDLNSRIAAATEAGDTNEARRLKLQQVTGSKS
jgi:hypothetical protein